MPSRFWMWTAVCAVLPDIDVVGFAMGIRYDDMFGHRGITHSLAFAAAVGLCAALSFPNPEPRTPDPGSPIPDPSGFPVRLFVYFFAVVASHGLLDALTNGGRGIAFLAPFSNQRFFFPWRPVQVSPIGPGFFSPRGIAVLASELRWIVLPSAIIAVMVRALRRPAR